MRKTEELVLRLAQYITNLGSAVTQRTEELDKIPKNPSEARTLALKPMLHNFAKDMDDFVA